MIDSRTNRFARDLFGGLPSRYDVLAEVLSFGQNRQWRRALVEQLAVSEPQTTLDVATGTAGVAMALARRTQGRIVGVDVTETMLRQGQINVRNAQLAERVKLMAGAAERLPFRDASFDAVSFSYLLRYVADPAGTLTELVRVLKPGGWMASLEFLVPPASGWYACWSAYTRGVLPIAGWLGGRSWHRVGRFLGPSIEAHYRQYPLDWTVRAWQAAGMQAVRPRVMSWGGGVVMWGQKIGG